MADLEPAWEYRTDDNVWSVCLSRDGQLLVVGSWDSTAYALDRSGEVLWRHKTSDYVKGIGISNDRELTVVGSYDRYIYAIKASGKLAWRYKTENYVRAVGISADGEFVAAGSWRGTLYYLDKRGKLLWKQRVGSPLIDLGVSGNGGLVVAGCEDGSVHAYDSGGNEVWVHKSDGTVTDVAVSTTGDKTVVAAKDTLLVCIDEDGKEVWRFHLGGSSKGLSLIQSDEIAVAFTDNNFLQYIDGSGSLMFMRRLPEEIWDGSVADDGITVAVATKDNRSQFFENKELANVVLEACQQTLEKVVTDNVDIEEAQEMHHRAGELLAEGDHGEAIKVALEARAMARKMHRSTIGDRARSLMEETGAIISDNPDLDMRKATRYLEKARRDMDMGKLHRVIFYCQQAKAAAEDSVEKGTPAVEEEPISHRLGGPIDTDESDVDRLLGEEVEEEAKIPEDIEEEPGLADDLADEIGEEVAEMGVAEDELTAAPDEGLEEIPEEAEEPHQRESDPDRPEALGEPPDEIPVGLYVDDSDGTEVEASEDEEADEADADGEMQDVCPKCGEVGIHTEDGECKSCLSDEVMKFAIDEAKGAHKDGKDISSLAPDLKAVKAARQEKDFDEVMVISERIVSELEDILGKDLQGELDLRKQGKRKKKKKLLR